MRPVIQLSVEFKIRKVYNVSISPAGFSIPQLETLSKRTWESFSLGTHSLRSGGASDPGCKDLSDMAVQSHGGWKSVQSKNKYIQQSAHMQFEVSKNLSKYHRKRKFPPKYIRINSKQMNCC